MSRFRLFAAAVIPMAFVAGAALASPITIYDTVAVAAVKTNTNYTPYAYTNEPSFEGYRDTVAAGANRPADAVGKNYYWGDIVGDPNQFDADSMEINRGATSISFTLKTKFNGSGVAGTKRSDWFINTGTPLVADTFNYAIALGSDKTRGTLTAGFYQVTSAKTSMDVWSGTNGYAVGGLLQFCSDIPSDPGICDATASSGFALAPYTLLASGTKIGDVSVNITQSAGWYYVQAVVSNVADMNIFNAFDILASSADCSNDALWGTVVTAGVPAPGALALVGLGLLGLRSVRRRKGA